MNHIYKTVWNEQTGGYVAVSEVTKSRGKRSGSSRLAMVGLALVTMGGLSGTASAAYQIDGATPISSLTGISCARAEGTGLWTCDIPRSDGNGFATITGVVGTDGEAAIANAKTWRDANNLGAGAIAFGGLNTKAPGSNAIAIGSQAEANNNGTISIGQLAGRNATTNGGNATFPGFGAGANVFIADGAGMDYRGDGTVAIGIKAGATGSRRELDDPNSTRNAAGDNNVLLGSMAGAGSHSDRSVIIGSQAGDNTTNDRSVLIGNYVNGQWLKPTRNAIGIGSGTQVRGWESMGIGFTTRAYSDGTIALGRMAQAGDATDEKKSVNATAIGNAAKATATSSLAIGTNAYTGANAGLELLDPSGVNINPPTSGDYAVAIGHQAQGLGENTIAIGKRAGEGALGFNNVMIGDQAGHNSQTPNNIFIGQRAGHNFGADPDGNEGAPFLRGHNVSMGMDTLQEGYGENNTAIGLRAGRWQEGSSNTHLGSFAGVAQHGDFNVNAGYFAGQYTDSRGSVNIGLEAGAGSPGNRIQADKAVSIGYQAKAIVGESVAIGNESGASGYRSVSLGAGTEVNVEGGVALGAGSVANRAAGTSGYIPAGATASQQAAIEATTSILAGVSVGDEDNGHFRQIHGVAAGTEDSDAVNVSQLKGVENIANAGWNVKSNDGSSFANIGPDGDVNFEGDDNITIVQTGGDDNATLQVTLEKDIKVDSVNAGGTLINSNGLSFVDPISDVSLPNTVAVKSDGIDMGNNQITNLAAGTNSTDAVNLGQLKGVVEVFGGGATIGLDGALIAPTYVVGNADQEFNTVGDAIEELNTGWTVKSDGAIGGNTDGSAIQARDIVDIGVKDPADENLLVESKQDGDTTTIDFSLNQNLKLTSVNAGGTLINSNGLSFVDASGVQRPNTVFIKPDGIDMGGNKITNVAPGTIGEDSTDAINGSQLYATNKKIVNIIGDGADIDEDGNITMPDFPLYDYKGAPVTSETVWDALGVAQNHYYSVNADPDLGNFNNDGATGKNALAAGVNTLAEGDSSIAIGDGAMAFGDKSISIGQGNIVEGSRSTAIGDPNIIIGSDSHAVGNDNYIGVFADNSLAFGNQNTLTSDSTVSVGNNSTIGLSILSNANNAISVGHDNSIGTGFLSTATNAISLGNNNKIATGILTNGNNAISVGNDNTILSEDAIALGNNITIGTGLAGSVGIGANSTVAAASPESDITIGNFTHYFAGDDPQSVVSFGSAGNERQLTNVAAGRISATSTDAINGSQLFAVSDVLGNTVDFIGLEGFADGTYGITFDGNTYTSLGDVLNSLHWNIDVGDGSGPGGSGGSSSGGSGSGGDKTGIHHGDTLTLVAGDNIVIEKTPDSGSGDTDITIGLAPDITVDNVVINEDLTVIGKTDLAGGTLIVEDNSITVGSDTLIDMGDNRVTNVADGVDRGDAVNKGQLDDTRDELIAKGLNFVGDDGQTVHRDLGQTLSITGGATGNLTSGNIGVVEDGAGGLSVQLAENIDLGSNGSVTMGDTTVNNSGIAIYNSSTDNTVSLSKHGLDNGGNRITNVAPGIAGTDAVNVDQLSAVNNNLQQQIDGNRYDIKRNNNRANAGIAAAMATAGLPQAYLPGKSMVAVAGGVWRGESGVAIGVSTVSENGKWILKGSANTSGRGGAGGTIGAGYQW